MEQKISITKLDVVPDKPVGGKKHKTLKTFPRGIMKSSKVKIKPVSDPAKHPQLKKTMKKHTIRFLTDSGVNFRRKTIKKKLSKMSNEKVKELAIKSGLSKGNAPPEIIRQIVEGGMLAGFISEH